MRVYLKEQEELRLSWIDRRDKQELVNEQLLEALAEEQMRRARAENRVNALLAALCFMNSAQADANNKLHEIYSKEKGKLELAG